MIKYGSVLFLINYYSHLVYIPQVTFDLCHDLIDDWVLVEEDQIANAVHFMVEHHHKVYYRY